MKNTKTFGELKPGDIVYRIYTDARYNFHKIGEEEVVNVSNMKYYENVCIALNTGRNLVVKKTSNIYRSYCNTLSPNYEVVKKDYLNRLETLIEKHKKIIKESNAIIDKCNSEINKLGSDVF